MKAYEVERTGRFVTHLIVHANTAAEAKQLAREGEGEAIDTEYEDGVGAIRRVRRSPDYDSSGEEGDRG